jgi:hypothetical protein
MHYLLEVVMPPVDEEDLEEAIESILSPFKEDGVDEDGYPNEHAFWDWWVIGGRWAGAKQEHLLGADNIQKFREELASRNVTVSGLQCGKPEISPAEQIPMVDALWHEWFPDSQLEHCPLFAHSNDQYRQYLPGDVMPLSMLPEDYTASKVIVAEPQRDWGQDGNPIIVNRFNASTMVEKEYWNGVSLIESTWSGRVSEAIETRRKKIAGCRDDYRESVEPNDNWLVVTVDYHS